jgi:hypothetical protein
LPDDEFAALYSETELDALGDPSIPNTAAIDQVFGNV